MSLKAKLFSIITLAAGVVVFSTGAFAQDDKTTTTTTTTPDKVERRHKGDGEYGDRKEGRDGMRGHHGEGKMGDKGMMSALNLTDAQKEQIRSIRMANKPDKATMEEFRTLGRAKHDGTITADQQTRLSALKTQAREKAKSVHEQVLGVLTAEQKAQIETRKTEMRQRMEERKQMRQQKPAATTTEKPKDN